jgi:LysM repeat protein
MSQKNTFWITLVVVTALLAGSLPVAAQEGGGPLMHVVQPEENLFRIALRYNITVDTLMQANGLTDADLVVAGTALIIPVTGAVPVAVPANPGLSGTHTVAPGEHLLQIARRYGVSPDDLIRANHIVNPELITVGQALIIPGTPGSATGQAAAPDASTDNPQAEAESVPAQPEPAPDLGILPADAAPPGTSLDLGILSADSNGHLQPASDRGIPVHDNTARDHAVLDLGILTPGTANWMLQPGIFSTGDADTLRDIYRRGRALGNDPHAFSKIGDCNSEAPFFLAKFDRGEYNLGPYTDLQPVIDQFAGSFDRQSLTVWTGNHAWALFDATWSNPVYCQAGETPIACEFRLQRPSLVLIRLGTNEAGQSEMFETSLRQIIEFSIERGVIPVLSTKADRIEGSDRHNEIVRALAGEYGVPLWDFGRVADTLPARGLMADGFHMTYVPPDYTSPAALQSGHAVQNLMALIALNTVWRHTMY